MSIINRNYTRACLTLALIALFATLAVADNQLPPPAPTLPPMPQSSEDQFQRTRFIITVSVCPSIGFGIVYVLYLIFAVRKKEFCKANCTCFGTLIAILSLITTVGFLAMLPTGLVMLYNTTPRLALLEYYSAAVHNWDQSGKIAMRDFSAFSIMYNGITNASLTRIEAPVPVVGETANVPNATSVYYQTEISVNDVPSLVGFSTSLAGNTEGAFGIAPIQTSMKVHFDYICNPHWCTSDCTHHRDSYRGTCSNSYNSKIQENCRSLGGKYVFSTTGNCKMTDMCGFCEYTQYIQNVTLYVRRTADNHWVPDYTLQGLWAPFTAQTYAPNQVHERVYVSVFSNEDPSIVDKTLTSNSFDFGKSQYVAWGRNGKILIATSLACLLISIASWCCCVSRYRRHQTRAQSEGMLLNCVSCTPNNAKMQQSYETLSSASLHEGQAKCVVCFSAVANTIFPDCGHHVCCKACALQLFGKQCPICRSTVTTISVCDASMPAYVAPSSK